MGSGAWSSCAYRNTVSSMGFKSSTAIMDGNIGQSFSATELNPLLNPYGVIRECLDTEEHPETIPVMLCMDCTGSMGQSLKNCFAQLDATITQLLKKFKDIEICIAGIGDFAYDKAPFQLSQYESDNRILDHLLAIWQERGGGANKWESYTAAWYAGLYHTKLDCWKRGKKGIIVSLGDEGVNPYLPKIAVNRVFGDNIQADIDTEELLKLANEKFDIYHIAVTDKESSYDYHKNTIEETWRPLLGQRLLKGNSVDLPALIEQIVTDSCAATTTTILNENGEISW